MSFSLKKSAIKAVLPMVTEYLPMLDPAVEEYRKSWIEKRPLLDKEYIVCVLFFLDKKMYISVVVINADNQIIQQLQTLLFSEFVTQLLDVFKNT